MQEPRSQQGLLEDLLTLTTFPKVGDFIDNGTSPSAWKTIVDDDSFLLPSSFSQLISPETFTPFSVSSYDQIQFKYDDESKSMAEDDGEHDNKINEKQQIIASDDQISDVFSIGLSGEKKSKSKKVEGQPSKNLMAERRRRKRLNDRLSMLRSIVPKISKKYKLPKAICLSLCPYNPPHFPISKKKREMQEPRSQQGLLEDLLTLTTFPKVGDFIDNGTSPSAWKTIVDDDSFLLPPSFSQLISPETFTPFSVSSYDQIQFKYDDESKSMAEDDGEHDNKINEKQQIIASDDQISDVFSIGLSGEKKNKSKKVEGQPSKNLMAERRRRKRLNDRLSMLRSIVPKISKMDRTSILGDTIDYMKELSKKIHDLKEQNMKSNVNNMNFVGSLKELNLNPRNPPKFEVERRNMDTRIKICCSSKPGLLLSTVNTLEVLGLDIQQCVMSCFNDFSLQASCSEAQEHRTVISSQDMKQILIRNAGCGGRSL